MTIKSSFFLTNSSFIDICNKQILNTSLFTKVYFRDISKLNQNTLLTVLDNFENTSLNTFKDYPAKSGNSVIFNEFVFKHKHYKAIQFSSAINVSSFKFGITTLLSEYLNYFELLSYDSSLMSRYLFLLSPVKGGYLCYSLGFIGFLPKSQYLIILKFVLKKFAIRAIPNQNLGLYALFSALGKDSSYLLRLPFVYFKFVIRSVEAQTSDSSKDHEFFITDMDDILEDQSFTFFAKMQEIEVLDETQ